MATATTSVFENQARQQETQHSNLLDAAVMETLARKKEEMALKTAEYNFKYARAKLFAKSGLFGQKIDPDNPSSLEEAVSRAMVRIDLGESMGFSAAESLQGIHIIADQVAVAAQLRAARMQSAGFDWDIQWHWAGKPEISECAGITLYLKRNGKPMLDRAGSQITVSYLKADAERMLTKVWEGDRGHRTCRTVSILEKDNWKMSPRNMYFSRCITNTQRWYAPGVLSANLPSIEEVADRSEESSELVAAIVDQRLEAFLNTSRKSEDAADPKPSESKADAQAPTKASDVDDEPEHSDSEPTQPTKSGSDSKPHNERLFGGGR